MGIREEICAIPDLLYLLRPFRIADEFGYHKFWFRALLGYNKKSATMKRRNQSTAHHKLLSGALYLFHGSDRRCPAVNSLYGIIDKTSAGIIYLESSSRNLRRFRLWHRLPNHYRYYRPASRSELRDYIFHLAYYECAAIQSGMGRTCCTARKIESCTHL